MILRYLVIGVSVAMVMFAPRSGLAAELIFNSGSVSGIEGEEAVIDIFINPQAKRLNAVEGVIQFSGAASDGLRVQVENGQSILPIWPTPPRYDESTKSIIFIGGVPKGFESRGLLFRLRLSPAISGGITIAYTGGSAYLNDGKGTKEAVQSEPFLFEVKNSKSVVADDSASGFGAYGSAILLAVVLAISFILFNYARKRTRTQ